jgi:hypothetical protein
MGREVRPKVTAVERRFISDLVREGCAPDVAARAAGRLTLAKRLPPARRERAVRVVAALVARELAS